MLSDEITPLARTFATDGFRNYFSSDAGTDVIFM